MVNPNGSKRSRSIGIRNQSDFRYTFQTCKQMNIRNITPQEKVSSSIEMRPGKNVLLFTRVSAGNEIKGEFKTVSSLNYLEHRFRGLDIL